MIHTTTKICSDGEIFQGEECSLDEHLLACCIYFAPLRIRFEEKKGNSAGVNLFHSLAHTVIQVIASSFFIFYYQCS